MHLAFTVTAILLAFSHPTGAHRYTRHHNENATTCRHPPTVEAFAASFYTALIVTQDQDDVYGLELPGTEAADRLFPIIANILENEGLCDANTVAWTASRAVAMADTLKLTVYFERTAYSVGQFLQRKGVLDCENVVPLALECFNFVVDELEGLEGGKYDSYMQGIVRGLVDFVRARDLELDVVAQELADIFYNEFSSNKQCKHRSKASD